MGNQQNIPGQNYNFHRLFTFISGTVYNRSYLEGYFVVTGGRGLENNLRSCNSQGLRPIYTMKKVERIG